MFNLIKNNSKFVSGLTAVLLMSHTVIAATNISNDNTKLKNLPFVIESQRQKMEELLNTKFMAITKEQIGSLTGRIDGSIHGKMNGSLKDYSPLSTTALGGLLGAALGGGAGITLGTLATMPFLASPLALPALAAGAALGGIAGSGIGLAKGLNDPKEIGQLKGSLEGSMHGELSGATYQIYNTPTVFSVGVVDSESISKYSNFVTLYKNELAQDDCTHKAIDILKKIEASPYTLTLTEAKKFSQLATEYNKNINSLKLLMSKNITSANSTQLMEFLKEQDSWRLSKRLVVQNFKYQMSDTLANCSASSVDDVTRSILKTSMSYETHLVVFDQILAFKQK